MVKHVRRALGFLLMPTRNASSLPEIPYKPEAVLAKACALRGVSDKDLPPRFMLLKGIEEADVLRNLRGVLIDRDKIQHSGNNAECLHLVLFRGVFGSGGYDVGLRKVEVNGITIRIEVSFEHPGDGIRTTAGFTQPTLIVPLDKLPIGKYHAIVDVRHTTRNATGLVEGAIEKDWARLDFKVAG